MENRKSTLYTVAVTVIITACLSFLTITTFYSRSQSAGEKKVQPDYGDNAGPLLLRRRRMKRRPYEGAIAGAVNTLGDPYTEYLPKRTV